MIARTSITRPANTTAYSTGDVINADGSTTPILLTYEGTTRFPFLLYSHLVSSNEAGTPAIDVYFLVRLLLLQPIMQHLPLPTLK